MIEYAHESEFLYALWIPYDDFPYTVSRRAMIQAAQANSARLLSEEHTSTTDSQELIASPRDGKISCFGLGGIDWVT